MSRTIIAISIIATIAISLTRTAHAEPLTLRLPHLPSVVTPLPRPVVTASTVTGDSAALLSTLTLVDYRFLSRVARLLDGMRPPMSGGPRDAAARNPTLRDPARERDATSFGIRTAPMAGSGAAFVGAGVGAGALQLVNPFKVADLLPSSVKLGPTMFQGGGGITLRARW